MFRRAKVLFAAACLLAAVVPARAVAPAASVTVTSTGSVNVSWTGGTSPFIAAISTTSGFSVYTASGSVTGNATNYPFLSPDTTYYFHVQSSGDTGYSASVTTATWAAAPTGIYSIPGFFSSRSPTTAVAKIGWNINGNPEWTVYELELDDDGNPAAGTSRRLLNGAGGAPQDIGGLNANTAYYFRVRSRGAGGSVSAFTPYITTTTLAMELTGISAATFESSATVSWTPVNGAAQTERAEGYRLLLSTSALISPLLTSWNSALPSSSSAALSGLDLNTTFYYKVGTLNISGTENYGDTTRFFTTLASPLQNLARLQVTDGSGTLGWTALPIYPGSASAMGYALQASMSPVFAAYEVLHSSVSYGVGLSTLTINTLDANTTYYFRAASLNQAYVPNFTAVQSSVTLALPLSPHPALTAVYPSAQAITIDFTPLEVTPQTFSCEGYRIEATTGNFGGTAPVFSSTTYDNQAEYLVISGLAPNNVYQLRIATLNWERTPNYTLLPSTRTGIPGLLTGVTLPYVWSSSAVVNFTPGIAAEAHVAQASPDQFFEGTVITSVTVPSATSVSVTGLDPNTTYFYRVGALYNGATVYTNTVPPMRQTLPVTVPSLGVASAFYSSVTVSWAVLVSTRQTETAYSYLLEASTAPGFSTVLSSSRTQVMPLDRMSIWGLSPNTSYYFRVGTVNEQNFANYSAVHATSTLANPPTTYAFGLTPDSITLLWPPNSNPADTRYLVEMDDDPLYGSPLPSSTTVLSSTTFSGLLPNTTYYSRVTAINRLDRRTPAVDAAPMATGAHHPVPAATTGVGMTGLTANWTAGGNTPLITNYRVQISSRSDFTGTVLSSVTKNMYASFDGLVSNASYYLRVSALNLSGVPTDPPVALASALTLPTTAYILPWENTFSGIMTDGFTVNWASNGNSSHTVYQVQASTLPSFAPAASTRTVQALTCTFTDLQIYTTYYVQVKAIGQSGAVSPFVSAGSTRTLLSAQIAAGAQQDNLVTLDTSYGDITVLVPSGAIGGYTRLTVTPSTVTLPAAVSAVSKLTPTGVGLAVTYFPPTRILGAITITLPYRIADLPPAAQADRSKLILALYDEINSIWVPLPSVSDTANNRVIGRTWHLSTFQIMLAQPEAGLSGVKIYPNPYRPNSVSDVMHFTNMPPGAKVKIYTFVGELVRELRADVNGMAHWDGLNGSGRKAASGVYIAFVQSADKKSGKSFKIAIER
jgi:hypothetical protein